MKSSFELQGGFIGVFLIFVLLTSSCATESWDFIGTWNYQPDKLTYINSDQRIKLTFPNDKWRVHTQPNGTLKTIWKNPWREDSSYNVLWAFIPDWPYSKLKMGIWCSPVIGHNPQIEANISLEEYLALMIGKMESEGAKVDYKVIQRKDRRIGVVSYKGNSAISFFFKEKGRFSVLSFICDEDLFESNKNQFWAIGDSYEYLE